jgi:hypothetical protein
VQTVETGTDEDGDPITAQVIDWQAPQRPADKNETGWTPPLQFLRRVLVTTLADHGTNVQPFIDAPALRACDLELVRAEFYRQYPAEGTEEQKQEARRKTFRRHINAAVRRSVAAAREIDGVQLIWLTKSDAAKIQRQK